ncbi:MAG: hypothetical protein AB1560_04315 [Pseudomonadota bacterium]
MSFFDTLRCDYPLPDPEFQERTFHTLNFRCLLDHYCLGTDGRLRQIHRKLNNPQGRPAARAPASEDTGYHGDLRFHAKTATQARIEYRARFTHGTVEWIRRVEQEASPFADSLEHLARDARYLGQEREVQLEYLLQRLERLDPEVAKRVVAAFDDRQDAALWLIAVQLDNNRLSPYEALAQGNRKTVLRMLEQISEISR